MRPGFCVEEPIERCVATNVDPKHHHPGHEYPDGAGTRLWTCRFGVYARVTTPGTIRSGDAIILIR
ncbi:MAG: MOSC domain-containing protein [Alphaproteobacteria bacterium]